MHYGLYSYQQRGVTVMLVLVFMGIFGLGVSTLAGYMLTQAKVSRAKLAREQAFGVAEAGLEYYRWFLAHNPGNLTNGTGQSGPYTYTVTDPEGSDVGEASISITGTSACGVLQYTDIVSEGYMYAEPSFTRTLKARHARPSVAEYSNIINANVWAGSDRNIVGPYHSNGGVRMDGTNNSTVTSAVSTWLCTSSFGCSPNQNRNGVFGAGTGSALWSYPVPQFDFAGIASNFSTLRTYAQNDGIYLTGTRVYVDNVQQGGTHTSVAATDQRGYRLVFRSDGTVDAYRVTSTSYAWGKRVSDSSTWVRDYDIISAQSYLGRYTIPTSCAVIYVNAKTWIEGVVGNKVTLVVADTGSFSPDIILNGNLTYTTNDGSVGLTAIAEQSVRIPLVSPDVMTVRGIFVAQSGYLGRNYYEQGGTNGVPSAYNSYVTQSSLTTIGTVVSNLRVGTQWTCGSTFCSGYSDRTDAYDRLLAFSPPPFTPHASTDYQFMLWREQ